VNFSPEVPITTRVIHEELSMLRSSALDGFSSRAGKKKC